MDFRYNGINYKIHIIHKYNIHEYSSIINNLICDVEFITPLYEQLSYDALNNEGYYGFFITDEDNTNTYMSLIVDLHCNQIMDKMDPPIDLKYTVEIVLLCSNSSIKVRGLVSHLFTYIITQMKKYGKTHVLLYIANKHKNSNAVNFYKKNGFIEFSNNDNIMIHEIKGGSQSKSKTKFKRRKSKLKTKRRHKKTKSRIFIK